MTERHFTLLSQTKWLWLFNYMAFTPLRRQILELHWKVWRAWGMCSIWAHVYISVKRSHMKHARALSVICLLGVCLCGKTVWILCMCYSSVSVHLFPSSLYIYVRDHVPVSAGREYRPAFCFWLTGVTPNCDPSPVNEDMCSEFGCE